MRAAGHVVVTGVLWAAALCQAATLVRYPYLQNVRGGRATVVWTTRESGSGAVEYSTDQSFSRSAAATTRRFGTTETGLTAAYFQHQAELTGLSPATDYFYRVMVDGQNMTSGDELRFRTAGPGPFSFLAFGDSGEGGPEQFRLAQRMMQERPALVLHTGDLAYPRGTFREFESYYFDVYRNLMKLAPFFPTPGNHEYYTNNGAPYFAVHSLPTEEVALADQGRYYSFDWGNVHFVSLDTNAPLTAAVNGTGEMLQWLERDLRKTPQFWRIVYFHHAAYPTGPHETDQTAAVVRDRVLPIVERYEVQLVLSGHEHNYQHTWPIRNGTVVESGTGAVHSLGTVHVITGGGGGVLHPVVPGTRQSFAESAYHYLRCEVQGPKMTLHAIRIDGQEIDAFTLAPLPVIRPESMVNAASFTSSVAPGTLVSIFGQNLADQENQAAKLPLPTELSGVGVTLNGRRLPLLYVSSTQINTQLPFDAQGPATLRVITPNGWAETPVTLSETAPAIFSLSTDLGRFPAILHPNGTVVSATSPATTGEFVSVYLTGLGRVNGDITAGQPAPSSPLLTIRSPVEVQLGKATTSGAFAGLAPGFVGLYQVNLQVPEDLSSGTHLLRIVARGSASNAVTVPVRSTAPPREP